MTDAPRDPGARDPLWRLRWALLAGLIVILAALGLMVSMHHAQWRWALFFGGIAVGVVGLATITLLFRAVSRGRAMTDDRQIWLHRRRVIYSGCWLGVGVIFGVTSAASDLAWIDIGFAIYVALIFLISAVIVMRHRNAAR